MSKLSNFVETVSATDRAIDRCLISRNDLYVDKTNGQPNGQSQDGQGQDARDEKRRDLVRYLLDWGLEKKEGR